MKVTVTIDSPFLTAEDVEAIEQTLDNRFGFTFDIGIVVEESE
jgi:hypothetical protein